MIYHYFAKNFLCFSYPWFYINYLAFCILSSKVEPPYDDQSMANDDQPGSSQHKVPKKAEYVNFPPPARHQDNQEYENPEEMESHYEDPDKMASGYVNTREVNNPYAAVITEDISTAPNTYDQINVPFH